jgi:hypothetical protein
VIPTSPSLDAAVDRIWEMFVATFPEDAQFLAAGTVRGHVFQQRLADLRRLQHEASTAPKVFDLDTERAKRMQAEMAVFHDDTEPAA